MDSAAPGRCSRDSLIGSKTCLLRGGLSFKSRFGEVMSHERSRQTRPSSFRDHSHRAPASDDALPVAANGPAAGDVDLRHEPESRGEAGYFVGHVFVAVDHSAVGFEFDAVGPLVIADAVGVDLALGRVDIAKFGEDTEVSC